MWLVLPLLIIRSPPKLQGILLTCPGSSLKGFKSEIDEKEFQLNLLEPDLQHVINFSCDFWGDLMIRSGNTNCIYIQNLQFCDKPVGK